MTEQTVTVTVPFAIRKRGGRKLVITPDGVTAAPAPRANVDSALLKALARGFRWRKLLETGDFSTIEEIADAENINPSYVSRVLRMTLAGAGDRGGHPGRAATAGANDEDSDGSVSGRVEGSVSFPLKSQLSRDMLLRIRQHTDSPTTRKHYDRRKKRAAFAKYGKVLLGWCLGTQACDVVWCVTVVCLKHL